MAKLAKRIHAEQPGFVFVRPSYAKGEASAKNIPRHPENDEHLLMLSPRQTSGGGFQKYEVGDLIRQPESVRYPAGWGSAGLTPRVRDMARAITARAGVASKESVREDLSVLADMMQDDGFADQETLNHLRNYGELTMSRLSRIVDSFGGGDFVIVATKPGYTVSGEGRGGYRSVRQLAVVRPATPEDIEAVADQASAHDAEGQAVLDRMMER